MGRRDIFGRYCIKEYNPLLVSRMKAIARHIYSTDVVNGERVVYEFEHNVAPKEIIITDKPLGLTSSYDRMAWNVFIGTGYIKDDTLAW